MSAENAAEKSPIEAFKEILANPATVYSSSSIFSERDSFLHILVDNDRAVRDKANSLFMKKMDPLCQEFARTVMMRGLFARMDDTGSALMFDGEVDIAGGISAGRAVMVLTDKVSDENSSERRHIIFSCPESEPLKLGLSKYQGTYPDFERLVKLAAKSFKGPA